jgi:hypothetical protein
VADPRSTTDLLSIPLHSRAHNISLSVRSSPEPPSREEIVVLNRYFIRPTTVDRIRASWIGDAIERYVGWLTEQNYAARNVSFRVPVLVRFGEFARRSGANSLDELPTHIEPFIEDWLNQRKAGYSESERWIAAREVRNPAATSVDSPALWE